MVSANKSIEEEVFYEDCPTCCHQCIDVDRWHRASWVNLKRHGSELRAFPWSLRAGQLLFYVASMVGKPLDLKKKLPHKFFCHQG
jgi:hypothetical protein